MAVARLWGQLGLSHPVEGAKLGSISIKNSFPANAPRWIYTPTDVNGYVNQKDRCKNVQRHFIPKNPELETFQMSINCRADKQIVYLSSGTFGDREKMNGHIWQRIPKRWVRRPQSTCWRFHLCLWLSPERRPSPLVMRPRWRLGLEAFYGRRRVGVFWSHWWFQQEDQKYKRKWNGADELICRAGVETQM